MPQYPTVALVAFWCACSLQTFRYSMQSHLLPQRIEDSVASLPLLPSLTKIKQKLRSVHLLNRTPLNEKKEKHARWLARTLTQKTTAKTGYAKTT